MNDSFEVAAIILMFVVRLGGPLLVMVAVAYGLRRLDAKWQAEARQRQAELPPVSPQNIPNVPPASCWTVRNCPPERRDRCPAFKQPSLACWLARKQAEGRLPELCLTCVLFKPPPLVVVK